MDDTLDSLSNVSLNESSIEFNVSEEIIHQPNERGKVIQLLLQLYSRHNLTKIAVEDVAKAMNAMPGAKVQIPATKYHLFNEFLSNSPQKVHRFIQCSECREYSKFAFDIGCEPKCEYCENEVKSSDIFFVQIEVQPQLHSIVRNNFDEILKLKQKILEKKTNEIEDTYDGQLIKKIISNNFVYTLTINTDGLIIHNSSQSSLYPILLTCYFLPPHLRFKENI